jgi:hypothetical protein
MLFFLNILTEKIFFLGKKSSQYFDNKSDGVYIYQCALKGHNMKQSN